MLPEFTQIRQTPASKAWSKEALKAANAVLAGAKKDDFACEGTWFVGVDGLPNTPNGDVGEVAFPSDIAAILGPLAPTCYALHKAQISAVYRGYPKPREGESVGQFAFRKRRHAAHVDGLLAEGEARRRYLREPHCYILGIALCEVTPENSPLIYWQGSAAIMAAAFQKAAKGLTAPEFEALDLTEVYQTARKTCFETCPEIVVTAQMGGAFLLNPLTLHGIGPWSSTTKGPRIVTYFRPQYSKDEILRWPFTARAE